MRLPHACECVCIAQMDSTLTSFVNALSEISSVTDPTYGTNSGGAAQSEISSLTDPVYGSGSRIEADAGVGTRAIMVANAVVMGVNSVQSGSGENVSSTISSVTFKDHVNLCECPECRSGQNLCAKNAS